MLTESFVAIMAMIGATVLEPGVYFAMNSPGGLIGTTAAQAAQVISGWGFTVTPDMISQIAQDVGEKTLLSRTGGAPTLAVGMAQILSGMFGGRIMMGIWYHFAILFEALFILTTVDAGTRVARFMIQDLIGSSNQMLAWIALILCTVVLFKMKRQRYAWVTITPTLWLLVCTLTAGLQKIFSAVPAIGFVAHAQVFGAAAGAGKILAPAKTMEEMHRVIFNDYVDATLTALV